MDRKFIEGKLSVIIPIYNAEKYLRKTLDSILVQTYKDIEIVLVDDCSNDDSANIIKEYIQKYPEIVYFLQETNQGAGAARNKALELATGQYVAFLLHQRGSGPFLGLLGTSHPGPHAGHGPRHDLVSGGGADGTQGVFSSELPSLGDGLPVV